MTGGNHVAGTPFYAAPEIIANGVTTKASDVYSYGVVAWEVYNCEPPWKRVDKTFQVRSLCYVHSGGVYTPVFYSFFVLHGPHGVEKHLGSAALGAE